MKESIFGQLNDYYHKKTFNKNWILECGNGNKKLDEIQVFFLFLENREEKINSIDFFDKNFKYKEGDVKEPGDLEYLKQVYQITHGNILSNYQNFQKSKNDQIKNQDKGFKRECSTLNAKDFVLSDQERYEYYIQDLKRKEKSAKNNIILLVRIDRGNFMEAYYKTETKWQDVIFVY